MKCFIVLAAIFALCHSVPLTVGHGKRIEITQDGKMIITSPVGKVITITKPFMGGQKDLDISITGPAGEFKRIRISDVKERTDTNQVSEETLDEYMRPKRSSKVVGQSQGDILTEVLREFQGVVDDKTYEKLLKKVGKYVTKGLLNEEILQILENLDLPIESEIFGTVERRVPMFQQGGFLGRQRLYQTPYNTAGLMTHIYQEYWRLPIHQKLAVRQALQRLMLQDNLQEQMQEQQREFQQLPFDQQRQYQQWPINQEQQMVQERQLLGQLVDQEQQMDQQRRFQQLIGQQRFPINQEQQLTQERQLLGQLFNKEQQLEQERELERQLVRQLVDREQQLAQQRQFEQGRINQQFQQIPIDQEQQMLQERQQQQQQINQEILKRQIEDEMEQQTLDNQMGTRTLGLFGRSQVVPRRVSRVPTMLQGRFLTQPFGQRFGLYKEQIPVGFQGLRQGPMMY